MKIGIGTPEPDPNRNRFLVPIVDTSVPRGDPKYLVAYVYGPTFEEVRARAMYIVALILDHPVVSALTFKESVEAMKD